LIFQQDFLCVVGWQNFGTKNPLTVKKALHATRAAVEEGIVPGGGSLSFAPRLPLQISAFLMTKRREFASFKKPWRSRSAGLPPMLARTDPWCWTK